MLAALKARLSTDGVPASQRIAELARLADLLAARQNQFFVPFAFVLMWSLQLAYAVESWRKKHGRAVAEWLTALGELEALVSLANYGYEHPADPMPEISDGGPVYRGEALAHPLLAAAVANDVQLGGDGPRLYLVSGSNMSGKSTLLRTVGVNAVLALAGGPVRARRLELSPMALGATLRIQDSLAEGASRFYAEITRLQQIVALAQRGPLLFLLDEILHGTNSHDRRIGGEAVVRALVEKGAIGLCTTHDLALSEMVGTLAPRAVNVHFEDHLENGKLVFDYRLRDDVVTKSNALALMRAVGLDV
jgi:DNA mismatch repair ATPase MutS